ncbi:MAG: hypothetical protein MUF49_08635 [Oculatellaceae cyanobacterium Prado106]|jgi:chromatin segregation and condensation protein Rec8/ScpA/Scc1 (kleisin family)|nr:hypothetical protein [Oculatellaceae cyanobacterium Prado106]
MPTNTEQFTLALKAAIAEATADPESVNLMALWEALEPWLVQYPPFEQLFLAGELFVRLAEICQLRAARLLRDWEEGYNDEGPLMEDDLLAGLVQQTRFLDVGDLIQPKVKPPRKKPVKAAPDDSVAGVVDRKKMIEVLEEIQDQESAKEQALSVAHDENVSTWQEAIACWMQQQNLETLPLLQLQQALKMPLIEVWLALLLGGYHLEQRQEFYETTGIWVGSPQLKQQTIEED